MKLLLSTLFLWCCCLVALAAPFNTRIEFQQPGGPLVALQAWGDDFSALFETLDGYTVVFDPQDRSYHYACLAEDGSALLPTPHRVGLVDPALLHLPRHLRLPADIVLRQSTALRQDWATQTGLDLRWKSLQDRARQRGSYSMMDSSTSLTTGSKVGLTLLIDFDDDPASISQSNVVDFLNSEDYTGFGNNGSVRQYFYDNSAGLLTYTNVVTCYVRIPNSLHPKSYYVDTTRACSTQAGELIQDALNILKAQPDYTTEILPTFDALTTRSGNRVLLFNVLYAGGNGGVFRKGLWPHSYMLAQTGSIELSPGGKFLFNYQISNLGSRLELATFCHETGHMLGGFPDLYDIDSDSAGGVGVYCLMGWPASSTNPQQFCAYLKYMANWATLTDICEDSPTTAFLSTSGAANNHFYRIQKPDSSIEYFLLENRQQVNHDALLPGSGIALWHIDEYGNAEAQSREYNTLHKNFLVTLVQADNQWHLHKNANKGDAWDLFYDGNTAEGYQDCLSDTTTPSLRWWDGTLSRLELSNFSTNGPVMSFSAFIHPISPTLKMTMNTNTSISLSIHNTTGKPFAIETTSDMQTWTPLFTNIVSTETNLADLNPDLLQQPNRFYRAISIP